MTRAYAIYRGRSLLVFNGTEQRDAYIARYMKFDRPQPVTGEEAARWKPPPGGQMIAIWLAPGGWQRKTIKLKQRSTKETA